MVARTMPEQVGTINQTTKISLGLLIGIAGVAIAAILGIGAVLAKDRASIVADVAGVMDVAAGNVKGIEADGAQIAGLTADLALLRAEMRDEIKTLRMASDATRNDLAALKASTARIEGILEREFSQSRKQ